MKSDVLHDLRSTESRKNRVFLPLLLWLVLAAGLLAEMMSPHLKIENNAFVIPPSLVNGSKPIDPAEIIAHAKQMQLLSLILTLGGAVSLGLYYRPFLIGRRSAR